MLIGKFVKDHFDQTFQHVPTWQNEGIIKHLTNELLEYSSEPVCSLIFHINKNDCRMLHEKSTLLSNNNLKLLF
jgi:hypothetical protein